MPCTVALVTYGCVHLNSLKNTMYFLSRTSTFQMFIVCAALSDGKIESSSSPQRAHGEVLVKNLQVYTSGMLVDA